MEYDFKLTQADALIIIQALGELPMKLSINTFSKFQAQMRQQDAAKAIPFEDLQSQMVGDKA